PQLSQFRDKRLTVKLDGTFYDGFPAFFDGQIEMRRAIRLEPFRPEADRDGEIDKLSDRIPDQMTRKPVPPPPVAQFIDINPHFWRLLPCTARRTKGIG